MTDYGVALAAYHDEQDASPAEVLFLRGGVSEAVLAAAADELLEADEHT